MILSMQAPRGIMQLSREPSELMLGATKKYWRVACRNLPIVQQVGGLSFRASCSVSHLTLALGSRQTISNRSFRWN